MDNKIKISILIAIWIIITDFCYAKPSGDSTTCYTVTNSYIKYKDGNGIAKKIKYKGVTLQTLLSQPFFTFSKENLISTNNGILLGWYFKLNNHCKVQVFFSQLNNSEADNIYLNDITLELVKNRKIKRIELTNSPLPPVAGSGRLAQRFLKRWGTSGLFVPNNFNKIKNSNLF